MLLLYADQLADNNVDDVYGYLLLAFPPQELTTKAISGITVSQDWIGTTRANFAFRVAEDLFAEAG